MERAENTCVHDDARLAPERTKTAKTSPQTFTFDSLSLLGHRAYREKLADRQIETSTIPPEVARLIEECYGNMTGV
jgi:hypothetical protein